MDQFDEVICIGTNDEKRKKIRGRKKKKENQAGEWTTPSLRAFHLL